MDPARFDYAVPLRKEGDSYLIAYQATVDANTLFFSGLSTVFALDLGSNALTEVFQDSSAIVPHHFVRADDLVVYDSGTTIDSVPKTGGATSPLAPFTRVPNSTLTGTLDFALDGDTGYGKQVTAEGTFFFSHVMQSGAEIELGREDRAKNSSFVLGADALYSYYPTAEEAGSPTKLFRVAKAGGVTELTFAGTQPVLFPVAARGDDLYLIDQNQSNAVATLYRASKDGGAVTPLMTTLMPLVFKGQQSFVDVEGGYVFRLVDKLFYVAEGGANAVQIACMPTSFTLHEIAAKGRTVFANVVQGSSGQGAIIRIPVP